MINEIMNIISSDEQYLYKNLDFYEEIKMRVEKLKEDIEPILMQSSKEEHNKYWYILFNSLKNKWASETIYVSSSTEIIRNKYHLGIIALGEDMLPFIYQDLEKRGLHWMFALEMITGENPAKDVAPGKIAEMTQAWIDWPIFKRYQKLSEEIDDKKDVKEIKIKI